MCWSTFLIKLQAYRPAFLLKKRLQHRCFLKKFWRIHFFVEHLTVHYTFSKFYVMIYFLDVFGYKIDIFHFLCHCFDFLHGPCLSVLVFTPKFLVSVSFARITIAGSRTILIESLKFRNNSKLQWFLPVTYCENCECEFFEYYALLLFLFRSGLARHDLK